jgi:hypothetical protein
MPKNKIEHLRNHLFEAIEMLKDGEIDVEKAKTIADLGQVIVNSAKVEVEFLRHVGGIGTDFLPMEDRETKQIEASENVYSFDRAA